MASQLKQGGAAALPTNVKPIRPKMRTPKANRAEDHAAISFARIAASAAKKLEAVDAGTEEHRQLRALAGIGCKLPCNNLRLIVSTLDEERDFDLRCTEVEVLKAEHVLEAKRIERQGILEGGVAWYESPTIRPLVDGNNRQWSLYRDRLLELAQTPARSRLQLERKKRLIGKLWLTCEGAWYDQLRAGVAADEAWLGANVPTRQRRRG